MYEPRGPIRRPNYELSEPKPFQTRLDTEAPELTTAAMHDRLREEQERILGGCDVVGSFVAEHDGSMLVLARRESKITTVTRNLAVEIPERPAVPVEGAYDFAQVLQEETFLMCYDGGVAQNRLSVYNVGSDFSLVPSPVYGSLAHEGLVPRARTQPHLELTYADDETCTGAVLRRENGTELLFSRYDREDATAEAATMVLGSVACDVIGFRELEVAGAR